MRPIIGILPMLEENLKSYVPYSYISAIESAGGVSLMLPYTERREALERFSSVCDGFLFAGGADIEPQRYGEKNRGLCRGISRNRDLIELLTFDIIYKTNKPVLGICRGAQLINVALGGTLIQDIESEIITKEKHMQGAVSDETAHLLSITAKTPLRDIISRERIAVNSYHHQAIKALGRGLNVAAVADDGIIEAVYMKEHPFLFLIQWHPERTAAWDKPSQDILRAFVKASNKNKE